MELDLNARSSKFKREELKRREQAKRRQQTEQRKREAADRARAALEAEQAARRVERLQEAARAEAQALEEQRLTGGIRYLQRLRPVATAGDGDKLTLPVSALEELNPQHALELGVFTFELSFEDAEGSTHRTHAGVLEFTAAEGTVGIPPKAAASLFQGQNVGGGKQLPETVQVKFVRLEKGKFASLQPRGQGFGKRELDFKLLLERALKAHTTLTEGDVVFVRHGRETFEVRVTELRPERAVNILNTDLEVALMPCEAVEKAQELEKQRELEAERALELARQKEQWKAERMAQLAPEPPTDERFQVRAVLRLPGGNQATRRFLHESPLRLVFDFIEALTGDAANKFQVAATYPRRLFGVDSAQQSLKQLGLNGRQEQLFVERLAGDESASGADADESMEDENALSRTQLAGEWEEARQSLEQSLDEVCCSNTRGFICVYFVMALTRFSVCAGTPFVVGAAGHPRDGAGDARHAVGRPGGQVAGPALGARGHGVYEPHAEHRGARAVSGSPAARRQLPVRARRGRSEHRCGAGVRVRGV